MERDELDVVATALNLVQQSRTANSVMDAGERIVVAEVARLAWYRLRALLAAKEDA